MLPFIYQSAGFNIPSYIFIISLTSILCLLWTDLRAKKYNADRKMALDLAMMILVGAFIGGRLFHVFYEGFYYYKVFPIDAFRFWDGGFVYYGGFIGAMVLSVGIALISRQPLRYWLDFFAPILAFGYGFGRLACLLNGCCYGKICHLPWAIHYTYPGLPEGPRHPTQLYATAWELFISLPLLLILTKKKGLGTGHIFYIWLIIHGLGRILMETFRADERGDFIAGLSISTWISLILIATGAVFLLVSKARHK